MERLLDDSLLVSQYLNGNHQALEEIIRRYKRSIFKSILTKVKSVELAEDIFQDTFMKIIDSLRSGKYNEVGKFLPWALRIANNLVMDYFRKLGNRKMISDSSSNSDSFNVFTNMKSESSDWVDLEMNNELCQQLMQLVHELPELQKEVVFLRLIEGYSFKEIAEIKGISINTALGRMRYAIQHLRDMIKERKIMIEID
jgi:RNA polymerase sigma-70 factor (ECF subfamily)